MSRATLRRLWLKIHRYCALSLGCVLAVAALLGALLTVAKPLDRALNHPLFVQATSASSVPLAQVHAQLQQEFGPRASFTLRPPRQDGDTLWAYVQSEWEGVVFLDAASGRELGRRGEHEGFYNLLFELHSTLLFGERGQAVLTAAAATYLVLLATGLVLWWPRRWAGVLRIRWRDGALRTIFDLHGLGGALLGLLLAVSVATGAYMAWPPLRPLVSTAFGERPASPPKVHGVEGAGAAGDIDSMVLQARQLFPGAMVGYVQLAGSSNQPVRVRLKLLDDPHPNGLTSVWFHPATGKVLDVRRWSELDAGHRVISFIYPLHIGALGGSLHTVLVGILGLALAGLGATGLWLWWKRRLPARSSRARSGKPA